MASRTNNMADKRATWVPQKAEEEGKAVRAAMNNKIQKRSM